MDAVSTIDDPAGVRSVSRGTVHWCPSGERCPQQASPAAPSRVGRRSCRFWACGPAPRRYGLDTATDGSPSVLPVGATPARSWPGGIRNPDGFVPRTTGMARPPRRAFRVLRSGNDRSENQGKRAQRHVPGTLLCWSDLAAPGSLAHNNVAGQCPRRSLRP